MSERNIKNLKGLLNYSMRHCDGTGPSQIDQERVEMLRKIMDSVEDPVESMKRIMTQLNASLQSPSDDIDVNQCEALVDELIALVENIDLAFDFIKLDSTDLLGRLLANGSLRGPSLELVAALSQNNLKVQPILVEKGLLLQFLRTLPEIELGQMKQLLSAISCLVRGYPEGMKQFQTNDGFLFMPNVLDRIADSKVSSPTSPEQKALFLLFSFLQEADRDQLASTYGSQLLTSLVHRLINSPSPNEYLLASIYLLSSGEPTVAGVNDGKENDDESDKPTKSVPLKLTDSSLHNQLLHCLTDHDKRLAVDSDEAHNEVRNYIKLILSIK